MNRIDQKALLIHHHDEIAQVQELWKLIERHYAYWEYAVNGTNLLVHSLGLDRQIVRSKSELHRVPYLLENLNRALIGNGSMSLGSRLSGLRVGRREGHILQVGVQGMAR
jgi:UDP-N-acetylenolpyruvoylglucosamine reductase